MSSLIIDPTLELVARNAASVLTGHVVQVLGPVIDVEFAQNHLPGIYNALEITLAGQQEPLIAEVQQHRDITGCER